MWSAPTVASSWRPRRAATSAMSVASSPHAAATAGATPWSTSWTASAFPARTPLTAATLRLPTMARKATAHRQVCPHAPCHCPAGESCGFIGSTAALLDHFAGAHSWPCTSGSKVRAGKAFSISLRVGFNFVILLADQDHDRDDGEQPATTGSVVVPCRLFLLNVTQERLGRAISVMCIHPHANGVDQPLWTTKCKLAFSHFGSGDENENLCRSHYHYQASEFKVVSTDLSNGLPIPDSCFQFIVPNAVLGDDDKDYIKVKVCISIN